MTKKRRRFQPSVYAIFLLGLLLVGAVWIWQGGQNPLFEKGVSTTLYIECYEGEKPDFSKISSFREEKRIDENKLSFDMTNCNLDKAGTYQVPVLYEGKETCYQIQVEVKKKTEIKNHISSKGESWAD